MRLRGLYQTFWQVLCWMRQNDRIVEIGMPQYMVVSLDAINLPAVVSQHSQ